MRLMAERVMLERGVNSGQEAVLCRRTLSAIDWNPWSEIVEMNDFKYLCIIYSPKSFRFFGTQGDLLLIVTLLILMHLRFPILRNNSILADVTLGCKR